MCVVFTFFLSRFFFLVFSSLYIHAVSCVTVLFSFLCSFTVLVSWCLVMLYVFLIFGPMCLLYCIYSCCCMCLCFFEPSSDTEVKYKVLRTAAWLNCISIAWTAGLIVTTSLPQLAKSYWLLFSEFGSTTYSFTRKKKCWLSQTGRIKLEFFIGLKNYLLTCYIICLWFV